MSQDELPGCPSEVLLDSRRRFIEMPNERFRLIQRHLPLLGTCQYGIELRRDNPLVSPNQTPKPLRVAVYLELGISNCSPDFLVAERRRARAVPQFKVQSLQAGDGDVVG